MHWNWLNALQKTDTNDDCECDWSSISPELVDFYWNSGKWEVEGSEDLESKKIEKSLLMVYSSYETI